MLSLNQKKQLFKDKQLNHAQLSSGTFLFDPPYEYGASAAIQYPLMGVNTDVANLNGNVFTSNFDFDFLDLVHLDDSNKYEVMSDMLQVALDVYSQIKYYIETYFNDTVRLTVDFEPRVSVSNDRAFGWGFSLAIEEFYDRSTCLVPDSGNHAGQVTIYNSDGSIAAYLNPNSTYTLSSMATDTADSNTSFSGTTFTLSHTPVFITGVFLNGQRLTLTTDYTVSGTTITFNNALANDIVVVVYSY